MRTLGTLSLSLGVMTLLAHPAPAQPPRGPGFGPGAVLMAPNVQKELKLSDEQVEKIQPTIRDFFESHRDDMMALRDLEPRERARRNDQITRELNEHLARELSLTPDQRKRYEQIQHQARGFQAFTSPEVQERLKLSDEQKAKIEEIGREGRERMQQAFQDAGDDRQAAMQKFREISRDLANRARDVLSEEQKATWKEMTGDPIEIEYPRPGR